ncbi:endonuclease domain-containing protein [Paenibacillus glycanilyticus]|uniref:endonuclease domain-containing protein n=1 Tax=Paenibacillus glycanilyticus TaxID=126569 RepID=UPI00203A4A73|nr:DUF559 domain-containing protein [Paenibacillus glycanilyticus]MCM3628758.1 endonuclease domain-containing protein [Paenibacillus glycanilyticus]
MSSQHVHEKWFNMHLKKRKGKAKERLIHGHAHAGFYSFKMYGTRLSAPSSISIPNKVSDFRDGTRYLDFAYLKYPLKLNIEIDGYGSHSSQASRSHFSDDRIRQNHLIIDGWRVLRFSYDDVNEKPRMCEQIVQQFMSTWLNQHDGERSAKRIIQQEILQLVLRSEKPIRSREVSSHLCIHIDTARRLLREMVKENILLPGGAGTLRFHTFVANRANIDERIIR